MQVEVGAVFEGKVTGITKFGAFVEMPDGKNGMVHISEVASTYVKEISDHVYLSASYVCTYFKSQTGQTLNQYLTEYRMEKAMQLLSDARYQITDISSRVGYSNGNYFSKSFKKFTGLTPSKYREKMLG